MGSLGWLDPGWSLGLSGAPLGRPHVPGVRVQAEGEAGGHSHPALGAGGSGGQEGDLRGDKWDRSKKSCPLWRI